MSLLNNGMISRRQSLGRPVQGGNPKSPFNGVKSPGLGDYLNPLHYRVFQTQGSAGQGEEMGVSRVPTIEAEGPMSDNEILRAILRTLERGPSMLSLEWRTRFYMQPRESVPFFAVTPAVTVAAGTSVAIVTQTITERFGGWLTHVGLRTVAPGGATDISWDIRVNGFTHPQFNGLIIPNNLMSPPFLPFLFELTQSRTVQLVATNNGAVALDVEGMLLGWMEYLMDYKPYGSSPASGIG